MGNEKNRQKLLKELFSQLREYIYYPRTFWPLALLEKKEKKETVISYYYHCDINGAPTRLTDNVGKIVWSEQTGVWGEKGIIHANEINNPLRFQGQYYDQETGLHYNRFRYYDPNTGNYISRDPIGLLGGINAHSYVKKPLVWIDPLGLACANVDADGVLNIKNKYELGSPEDLALRKHIDDWNTQIGADGGSMTRQAVTPEMRAAATNAANKAKAANPSLYPKGISPGHTPDVGWGGAIGGPIIPLNSRVNSYIGGATQAVPVGTTYNRVVLT